MGETGWAAGDKEGELHLGESLTGLHAWRPDRPVVRSAVCLRAWL